MAEPDTAQFMYMKKKKTKTAKPIWTAYTGLPTMLPGPPNSVINTSNLCSAVPCTQLYKIVVSQADKFKTLPWMLMMVGSYVQPLYTDGRGRRARYEEYQSTYRCLRWLIEGGRNFWVSTATSSSAWGGGGALCKYLLISSTVISAGSQLN